MQTSLLSSSSITGDTVVTVTGDNIGHIKDLMLDVESGKVAYAVLSFGGFLGMGDKLFAIPFQTLQLDSDNKRFILDVPKDKLEKAEGFDRNNWPDFSDTSFRSRTYSYYNAKPYWG
jgi:sporulation protein YlmC with PRC-barrel domain